MKKFDRLKTLQLVLFVIFALICILTVFFNRELFHTIANNPDMKLICTLLWICFGLSFIFIFIDFSFISSYKRDYHELQHSVHSDKVTGIANRNLLDEHLEKYLDKPLPEGFGCVTLLLTNLKEINDTLGYLPGTELLKQFAIELNKSALGLCIAGRNGGNKFLVLFEESSLDKINLFLSRVENKVASHNMENPERLIQYKYGIAFDETPDLAKSVNELIALSERRAYEKA